MPQFLGPVAGISPQWLLVLCVVSVFLESAVLLGLVLPGETAALVAGAGTALAGLSLPLTIGLVAVAAVLGDSVGYWLGRRWFGARLERLRLLRRYGRRIAEAQAYLRRRGGPAVVVARFTAFVRTAMPAMAGAARMPYRRFLAWNVPGGVVWAALSVLLGNLLGASYRHVERYVAPGFAVPAVVLVVGALVWRRLHAERTVRHEEEQPLSRP